MCLERNDTRYGRSVVIVAKTAKVRSVRPDRRQQASNAHKYDYTAVGLPFA